MTDLNSNEVLKAVIVYSFAAGYFFSLGVALASRMLPVVKEVKTTYDNLDKK